MLIYFNFTYSGHFYSASSSPLLLRCAPDYSIDTVSELTCQALWATVSEGLAQDPCIVARIGFKPATFQTQGTESTAEPPGPTLIDILAKDGKVLVHLQSKTTFHSFCCSFLPLTVLKVEMISMHEAYNQMAVREAGRRHNLKSSLHKYEYLTKEDPQTERGEESIGANGVRSGASIP